jgi:two-component system, chemotaxis family, CheB/CheR fusion protein
MSDDVSLKELLQELAEQRGFDFRGYKRTTLERRFRKRMFELSIGEYAQYGEYIRKNPEEIDKLLTTILINVTAFFRDPPAWEILRHEILPPLLTQLKPGSSFRAWSAGCASGEEAYSIAIILAEFFGPRISEFDLKIYATDIDEEELTKARRAEYSTEAMRRVRAAWQEKYFHGKDRLRVNREIRRLVIFGRSNLAHDAPISHVDLLVCRNVLIYFDSELQQQILARLHYALEPRGILFLGKSESQLANSTLFRFLNAHWRIFQRITAANLKSRAEGAQPTPEQDTAVFARTREELDSLRIQQRSMLDTLRLGVLVLAPDDTIIQSNSPALTLYGLSPTNLLGKKLQDTDFFVRTPELESNLQNSRLSNEPIRFPSRIKLGSEERLLEITIRPVMDERGERTGTFLYCENVTTQEELQTTVEKLGATSEALQSANQELETTNEELQSTNEELETTNEELQSTNEELETTNEELQSLNEELETTNQELEERSKELDQLNSAYAQTLEQIRLPVMLVNQEGRIEFWNSMALRLVGFKSKPPMELRIEQLPLPEQLRNLMIRRHRAVLVKQHPMVARNQPLGGKLKASADIYFSAIPREDRSTSVLIMFEPHTAPAKDGKPSGDKHLRAATRKNAGVRKNALARKRKAKRSL